MRNFTRINILSNKFVPTLNTSFNQSLRWQGKSGGKNSFQVFLNKISSQSSFRFERKIKENTAKGFGIRFIQMFPIPPWLLSTKILDIHFSLKG
jgi:hypothetical protein